MISVEDIRKLAMLARMKLSSEEEVKLVQDMDNILGYVQQIQEASDSLDASEPTLKNVFRNDTQSHESGLYTEKILNEAPLRDGAYVKVKKIL
ncbi:MAG: aspartyl/glutamyl-tRNA amidotransferase subunit C [bacterium]|nr:aspartyl/glutamyl-tRNA amidotransferase subunit C [bacterium]